MSLPNDSAIRKGIPLYSGMFRYFPDALAGVAKQSVRGNDKHNPGEQLHDARSKSADDADCLLRHLLDVSDLECTYATFVSSAQYDSPEALALAILSEADAVAWRALRLSQKLHEYYGRQPMAPAACEVE